MRPVSISDFINIVFSEDSKPPSPATLRRHCAQKDENGQPFIPGAFKHGKSWKVDLDIYIPEMNRRIRNEGDCDRQEAAFIDHLALKLVS